MTKYAGVFAALCAPFPAASVKELSKGGRSFSYISARTVMNRLDDVIGPENWTDEYCETKDGLKCRLTVTLAPGVSVSKEDGGGFAGMSDSDDDEKTAFTSSFKRAAVKLGIGRYLYRDGVPGFCGDQAAQAQATEPARNPTPAQQPSRQTNFDNFKIPSPGKSVYAWAKAMENHFGTTLCDGMKKRGFSLEVGGNFVDWTVETVGVICGEVIEYLKELPCYKGEFDKPGESRIANMAIREEPEAETVGTPLLKSARQLVVDVAKAVTRTRLGRTEVTDDEVRTEINEIAKASANRAGAHGISAGKLSECTDLIWLQNMQASGAKYLKAIQSLKAGASNDGEVFL